MATTTAEVPVQLTLAQQQDVLAWFTGKANLNAEAALDMLHDSIKNGSWLPGHSKKVRAALTKANVAKKLAKSNPWLDSNDFDREQLHNARFGLYMAMMFGGDGHHEKSAKGEARDIDFSVLESCPEAKKDPAVADIILKGRTYVDAMRPAFRAMRTLDQTRPKPVFTTLECSPTVAKTLLDAGLDLDLSTLRVCPMEWKRIVEIVDGRAVTFHVAFLLWPTGTKHGTSRFSDDRAHCEACGHAIRNNFNWVPLVIDAKAGTPHSLWVGRDCAKTLFGIDMTGDLRIEEAK